MQQNYLDPTYLLWGFNEFKHVDRSGIVLVCALPYKVLTASRTIMAELAHPLSLSLGPRQRCYQAAVTL